MTGRGWQKRRGGGRRRRIGGRTITMTMRVTAMEEEMVLTTKGLLLDGGEYGGSTASMPTVLVALSVH